MSSTSLSSMPRVHQSGPGRTHVLYDKVYALERAWGHVGDGAHSHAEDNGAARSPAGVS